MPPRDLNDELWQEMHEDQELGITGVVPQTLAEEVGDEDDDDEWLDENGWDVRGPEVDPSDFDEDGDDDDDE
jgi:hypothetical protein